MIVFRKGMRLNWGFAEAFEEGGKVMMAFWSTCRRCTSGALVLKVKVVEGSGAEIGIDENRSRSFGDSGIGMVSWKIVRGKSEKRRATDSTIIV